jgi:signal transduction histidine kinase
LASLVREIEARQAAARLGAQIGHDLANFLAALRFQAELIEEADLKRTITRTTDRAFEVVKYLQDTAKRELSPPAAFDLVDFLDESVETARALCPAGVNLEAENSFELGEVRCLVDRSVLERSLLNLVKNSVEAGSSEIKINLLKGEESRRMFDRSIATFGSIGDGSFVVLVVDDNGSGIAAHEVEKLSIWGFSTKSLEGGPVRGLGFLTLTALTSLYGAEVSVQSKRNVGTAVTVRLPTM